MAPAERAPGSQAPRTCRQNESPFPGSLPLARAARESGWLRVTVGPGTRPHIRRSRREHPVGDLITEPSTKVATRLAIIAIRNMHDGSTGDHSEPGETMNDLGNFAITPRL